MKLVTWNTQWCRGLDGQVDPQRIVEGARALADFDVLCLQEIASGYSRMPGAPGDQPAALAALLPGYQVFFGAAVEEWHDGLSQRFGNLIATRLPVARVEHHPLPWPADPQQSSMPRMTTVVTVVDRDLGALRIMTTHLEYYSSAQRLAQAEALRALHAEACGQAAAPPKPPDKSEAQSPFKPKAHTPHAILCGDFNMPGGDPAVAAIEQPFLTSAASRRSAPAAKGRLCNAWPFVHGGTPQPPTFRVFDRSEGGAMACDLVFVSDALTLRLRRIEVDSDTRASDHQPVFVEMV